MCRGLKPRLLINIIVKKYNINYILFFKIIILIKYRSSTKIILFS